MHLNRIPDSRNKHAFRLTINRAETALVDELVRRGLADERVALQVLFEHGVEHFRQIMETHPRTPR